MVKIPGWDVPLSLVSGKVLCGFSQPALNPLVAAILGLPRFELRLAPKTVFNRSCLGATMVHESRPHRLLSVDEFPAGS
jgi:hypothetical protein